MQRRSKSRVYIETTVVSYLTARPSRDLRVAAHQDITLEWWARRRGAFDVYVSRLVLEEASRGSDEPARRRVEAIAGIPRLELTEPALALAQRLIEGKVVPRGAAEDALHVAVATVHGMDYLLSWNCRHIANAAIRNQIVSLCDGEGFVAPVICTPEEILEEPDEGTTV
jgi:predicted nucleic acid-binding protein